ncbi:MAG: GAF domain-containing protein [Endomicrobiales bacterium]|nr:GAF domain-containing protein [Endomicrobiales bacterium]
METARELELLRESWTETFDQLFVLYEVAREASSALDINAILDHVINHAYLLLEAESAALLLVNSETRQLEFKVVKSENPDSSARAGKVIDIGEGLAGRVLKGGKPVIIGEASENDEFRAECRILGIGSPNNVICVPVFTRGGLVRGVIEVINKKKNSFSTKDKDFLTAVSGILALALENLDLNKEFARQRAYFLQAFENMPEGFLSIDGSGKIISINHTAKKQLGLEGKHNYAGESCAKLLVDEPEIVDEIKDSLLNGQSKKWKEQRIKKTNTRVYLFTFVFKDDEGTIVGVGVNLQNVVLKLI